MLTTATAEVLETSPVEARSEPPQVLAQRVGRRTLRRHFFRTVRRGILLLVADIGVILAARTSLAFVRGWPASADAAQWLWPHGILGGASAPVAIVLGLFVMGAYMRGQAWAEWYRTMKGVGIGAGLALWSSFDLVGIPLTLLRWLTVVLVLGGLMALSRWLLSVAVAWFYAHYGPPERVIFVGKPDEANAECLWALADSHRIESVGWLSEYDDVEGHLGEPALVWEALSKLSPDTVVICGTLEPAEFHSVVEAAMVARCRILSVRRFRDMTSLTPRNVREFGSDFMELSFPALTAGQLVLKRAVDVIASGLGLLVLSPLLGLIAAAIKLDSKGPVFFSQPRVGFGGGVFRMLKFRTMRHGADDEKADLAHLNHTGDPRLFKIPNDPRVTRVGTFLRGWSLDELPQLINVFRGAMSLVGPRPFFPEDLHTYQDHHFLRLAARPGITGLWQVRGRSDISDFEDVVALDREYIDQWSPTLDVKILALTLPAVIRRHGAY